MQLFPASSAAVVALFLLISLLSSLSHAHNITQILAKHPEFSTFNHYLSETHLADEINRRRTITVCAVDNAGMADLLAKHLSIYSIKNVLSAHIIADYFGSKKLHQITDGSVLAATVFQATGAASGISGFVNITDLKGGKVGFGVVDSGTLDATYVKSLVENPYVISVIQLSNIMTSPDAEAPASGPGPMNLTALMEKQGCKAFSDLLKATGAVTTFEENLDGGLAVFCPTDSVISGFSAQYKNLTAAGKVSLLLYHGVPVYLSMGTLKSNNGVMNTLATDGKKKFDFTVQNNGESVTLKTKVVTASITGTLIDQDPLAVYKINKVLLPKELFKSAPPSLAPKAAPAPKGSKAAKEAADSPDLSPDDEPADQTADENVAVRFNGGGLVSVVLGMCLWAVSLL